MSALLEAQYEFARKMTLVYQRANELYPGGPGRPGWKFGRGLCCPSCSKDSSLHRLSLAEDLLVVLNGEIADYATYLPLGEYAESLGLSWGGRFDLDGDGRQGDDPNHFSLKWEGRR